MGSSTGSAPWRGEGRCDRVALVLEGVMNWRPRKIAAAAIGWPSALGLGLSGAGMLLAPEIAVWPLGISLLGIAIAVIVSSKTLRQKMAGGVQRLVRRA